VILVRYCGFSSTYAGERALLRIPRLRQ
jgi:hypothetical protein